MNPWLIAAAVLLVLLIAPFILCSRGDAVSRLVGLQAGSVTVTMILLLLAVGFNRDPFTDLALTLALLTFGSGLVFARFIERWL